MTHLTTQPSPWSFFSADEELRAIGVGSSIGHGQDARSSVLEGEVLIFKLVAIDGLSTGSVVVGEVAALCVHTSEQWPQSLFSHPQSTQTFDISRPNLKPLDQ